MQWKSPNIGDFITDLEVVDAFGKQTPEVCLNFRPMVSDFTTVYSAEKQGSATVNRVFEGIGQRRRV